MSDRKELEELSKIELESLSDSYDTAMTQVAEDRKTHNHMPLALSAFLPAVGKDGMTNHADLKQVLLMVFMIGLEEGRKGKTFADYTRCVC